MFSIPAAPAKQSVSDTINILSGRLHSATLLEDRRAAILGLRSFAKDFPASVASGALRSLIGSLAKDGDDVDTVKVVLETLLMLFNPNDDSPEASDEIVLWLADEFTQRQENITLLLGFLESTDFYPRLYSLQLLAAILSARTQRTEECVFTAPLGISHLVAALDDQREAVRNEAIGLLTGLTPTSAEIQKLVAFENAFERIFAIVETDGSLSEGGSAVEDCLILLANLLRRNASNQSLFRESGCMTRLGDLLRNVLKAQHPDGEVAAWAQVQRNRNMYAFLAVIRLFLAAGSAGVSQNQNAFWKHGLVYHVLQLAFSRDIGHVPIKAEALITCGDMIRNAQALQESFAQLTVPSPLQSPAAAGETPNGSDTVYVIDGLLDLILNTNDQLMFDLRFAACECLKAYLSNHSEVRLHFLNRAIDGYQEGSNESANILTVLLRPDSGAVAADPYRQWFATAIAFHLLHDNAAAKAKALGLTEGDSEKGEEVVTCIQTVTAHLISGIGRGDDPRSLVGYLMLLLGWMFEDMDAVNDFLAEGSNVQSLIQAVSQPLPTGAELVQGLSAMLLGVAYEFSTKDSPIPRATLHSILTSRLGRDRYLDRLSTLRAHPLIRDFEVTPQKHGASSPNGLPDVFFDAVFVEFFKDSYSRIARAIDRAPELEISVVANGIQRGISRELVDSLRDQVEDRDRALEEAKAKTVSLEELLEQRQAEQRHSSEWAALELSKLRGAYETLQRAHETELRALQSQQSAKEADYQKNLAQARKTAQAETDRAQLRTEAEAADLRATISRLEVDLIKVSARKRLHGVAAEPAKHCVFADGTGGGPQANKSNADDVKALQKEHSRLVAEQVSGRQKAEERGRELETRLDQAKAAITETECKAKAVSVPSRRASSKRINPCQAETARLDATKSRDAAQSELDDLLMVFGDLEEKAARYKASRIESRGRRYGKKR
ncbi:Ribosomal protein arginine N-methyltransferase rmt3 [Tolypocladium paradoxum]|uniref:Ribosomal protein arginine N-methyltransferase rmt3 n=1 Tax=Tolypocladium paradoxum TaxID=94208 RepID=A0A2S4KSX3_9HYPO|nr:Ribosomal protein arginine N-methyltransferase rmt3 [Tolypocladium paradoxum]